MGIFTKLSNIFRSKTNSMLDNLENPTQMLDLKIADAQDSYNKVKMLSAEVVGNSNRLKKELEIAQKDVDNLELKINTSLSANNEGLAKVAIERKLKADTRVAEIKQQYIDSQQRVETVKGNLQKLQVEISDLRAYRATAVSRYNTAKVSTQINEMFTDVQSKNNSISINGIEEKIQKAENYAYGLENLNENVDLEFNHAVDSAAVELELQKYKAALSK